jgi:surfactin synthase thioesterase subunit
MTQAGAVADQWIRVFCPSPERDARLFCFPFAGGAASYFYPFAAALAPQVEVHAVQYPGRQDRHREPCLGTIPELARAVFDVVREAADQPYLFFGHSMGAIIAYEVARLLGSAGLPGPEWLLVSGQRAPSRQQPEDFHLRDDEQLVEELRTLGGTDPRWLEDRELLATILPPIRNDYRAIETYAYVPGPPLSCPVTALAADDDPYTSIPDVAAWREHSTEAFDLRVFTGGHFFLDDCREEVAEIITSARLRAAARLRAVARD